MFLKHVSTYVETDVLKSFKSLVLKPLHTLKHKLLTSCYKRTTPTTKMSVYVHDKSDNFCSTYVETYIFKAHNGFKCGF